MKNIPIKRNNIYKTAAPRRAECSTVTVMSSMQNISIGSLDSSRLKTELHNNTDEHSDALLKILTHSLMAHSDKENE